MSKEYEAPRRSRKDLMWPSELAITDAIYEVEKMGADIRLTNAEIKLMEARNLIADYIDDKPKREPGDQIEDTKIELPKDE
jgi:hypothetical protein